LKRRTVHTGFSTVALCFAAAAIWQWLDLRKVQSVAQALKDIPATLSIEANDAQPNNPPRYPETALATANALSAGNSFDAAESAFDDLIREHEFNRIGQAAQFNLANAYLRQGMREDVPVSRKGPMLELAKQRYRDLLRVAPDDWDARYNLERTLRLAPEDADAMSDDKGKPVKSVRVVVPDFKHRDLP